LKDLCRSNAHVFIVLITVFTGVLFVVPGFAQTVGSPERGSIPAISGDDPAIEARVNDLLARMTTDEKIDLIGGETPFRTHPIPRLNIPHFQITDGPVGAHIPAPTMAYAAGMGLAATWDSELAEHLGRELGRDARSRGAVILLGPGVNIYRAPMNGRNFEYFGEDPFLAARTAVGYIRGVQSAGVAATVKHYLGNNSEYLRYDSDSVIDERTMREIYMPAFEAAVKEAHVGAVMDGYNITNGEHMTQNRRLDLEVLKQQWHFPGVLVSDWTSVHDTAAAAERSLRRCWMIRFAGYFGLLRPLDGSITPQLI
jgi:beta-glucosidase